MVIPTPTPPRRVAWTSVPRQDLPRPPSLGHPFDHLRPSPHGVHRRGIGIAQQPGKSHSCLFHEDRDAKKTADSRTKSRVPHLQSTNRSTTVVSISARVQGLSPTHPRRGGTIWRADLRVVRDRDALASGDLDSRARRQDTGCQLSPAVVVVSRTSIPLQDGHSWPWPCLPGPIQGEACHG